MNHLKIYFYLFICISFSGISQSIVMTPEGQTTSNSSHEINGSLTVDGNLNSTKMGFTHPDGSVQLTAATNPNLPFAEYTTIYAIFENPDFDGDATAASHEGKVELVAANLDVELVSPAGSGRATARRRYRPLLIKKGLDSATPYLFEAFSTNQILSTVTIEFWRNDGFGSQELKFRYTLDNAIVVSILHLDNLTDQNALLPLEMVKLAFEELEIEDVENAKVVVLSNN